MVECDLAKVEVAGSTPVSRSMIFLAVAPRAERGYALRASTGGHSYSGRGTQVVRERSAKPLCVGSIPTRASNTLKETKAHPQHFLGYPDVPVRRERCNQRFALLVTKSITTVRRTAPTHPAQRPGSEGTHDELAITVHPFQIACGRSGRSKVVRDKQIHPHDLQKRVLQILR